MGLGIEMKHRWMHFRMRNNAGQIQRNGGMTLCYLEDVELNTIFYALAFCNKEDEFNKVTGRNKSLGRLNSRDTRDNDRVEIVEGRTILQTIREVYINNVEVEFEDKQLARKVVYYTTPKGDKQTYENC